jgi:hypothetical protein
VGDGVSRVGLAWCGVKCWELMMLAVEEAIRDCIFNMMRLGYGVWTVCAYGEVARLEQFRCWSGGLGRRFSDVVVTLLSTVISRRNVLELQRSESWGWGVVW